MSKLFWLFGLILAASCCWQQVSYGQHVVVSSYLNSNSSGDEWTELFVIHDDTDLRDYSLRDNESSQSSTAWQDPIIFNNIPLWNHLRAGTVILIWHRLVGSSGNHDSDVNSSDGFIQVSADDPLYFTGGTFIETGTLSIGDHGDIVQLRDPSNNHIHALGHRATTGAGWNELPTPKLNHAQMTIPGQSVSVCPGTNATDYGWSFPQSGTTYTGKSNLNYTEGLPNDTATLTTNSDFWRSIRQPAWTSPGLSAGFTDPSAINLSWNACTDPYPSDNTQGYIILRNSEDSFIAPSDGHTYSVGDMIGGASAIAMIPSSQMLSYTDNYAIPCGIFMYYRIYPVRYAVDGLNGNEYHISRGSAYNETSFGTANVTNSDTPVSPASATADPDEVCADYAGMIKLRAHGGNGKYLIWYYESCDGSQEGIGVEIHIPAPPVTTTYYALWTSDDCGISSCASVTVTVYNPPTQADAGPDQSVCNLLNATLQANTPTSGSGQWTALGGPGSASFSNPLDPNSGVTVSVMGIYTFRWTISTGTLCTDRTDEISIEFGDQVTVSGSSNSPVCEGEDITLYSSIPGAVYNWTGPGGFTSTEQNPVISNASVSESGEYTVNVSGIPGGCPPTSATITVDVSNFPLVPVVVSQNISGSTQDVCEGSTVTYSIGSPVAGSDYAWDLSGGGNITPSGSPDIIDIEWFATTGTFNLIVTEINSAGCESPAAALSVNIVTTTSPAITITAGNNPACAGTAVQFTAMVTDGGLTPLFQWTLNGIPAGTDNSIYILDAPTDNDLVSCVLTSASPCANPATVNSNAVNLTVYDSLKISLADEGPLCSGTPNLLSPGSNFASYLWSDGSIGQSITVEDPGFYWVMVTDSAGCTAIDTVVVEPCITALLSIPNAFTPNSDGSNDRFMVKCNYPEMLSGFGINIFNRWGQHIYSSHDIGEGWDGTFNGVPCTMDVYAFTLTYNVTEPRLESKKISGTIVLIR